MFISNVLFCLWGKKNFHNLLFRSLALTNNGLVIPNALSCRRQLIFVGWNKIGPISFSLLQHYLNFQSKYAISNSTAPSSPLTLSRTSLANCHSIVSAEDPWPFCHPQKIMRPCSSTFRDTSTLVFSNVQHSLTHLDYFLHEANLSHEIKKINIPAHT